MGCRNKIKNAQYAGMLSFFQMSQMIAFCYGADVEMNCGAVLPLCELHVPLLEVIERPVLNLSVEDFGHCQLCCSIAIRAQVAHKRVQIVAFSPSWQADTKCFQPGGSRGRK